MSSQVGLIIGASTVLVILVYLIAAASRSDAPTPGALPAPGETPAELPPAVAQRASSLRLEIDGETDPDIRHRKQHELVELLSSAGRLDEAAAEQEAIAQEVQSADAWARAGNLYFDWMRVREGEEQLQYARKTVDAYRSSLAIDSTNLGVRVDLGVAYQYVPDSSHLAIPEIEAVLAINPAHQIANYNRGVMLARSERLEEAIEQFQTVLTIVPPGEALHEQAREWLDAMQGAGS
jgi:tetratricopeptide (TPR) repeat protein